MKPSVRIPAAQLTLPGGYVIRVTYRSNLGRETRWGHWRAGRGGGEIVIRKDAPDWRRIEIFAHELGHASWDYALWVAERAEALRVKG